MSKLKNHHNILYLVDAYKVTHHMQYPKDTQFLYAYFESRGGKYSKVLFFGLQFIVKKYLLGCVLSHADIDEALIFYKKYFNGLDVFNEVGWRYIVDKHNGHLPIRIKAVPEGSLVPVNNVLFTVENTDPNLYWLTTWLETLLVQVWYPLTVCTLTLFMKAEIASYLQETSDTECCSEDFVEKAAYKLIDFGFRGVSSVESAAIGDAAFLVNFKCTDTTIGVLCAQEFYSADDMPAFSVPASEHSTVITWGQENEGESYANMLYTFPHGIVSCVSDSFNIFNSCSEIWGKELKEMVLRRVQNTEEESLLVIRPDSGNPKDVIVKVLEILSKAFGSSLNSKGYKELSSPRIKVLQGDRINPETLHEVLQHLKERGWCTDAVIFGCGSAILQKLNRDTQQCAFKVSNAVVCGENREVFKMPITDTKKASKKGRLTLQFKNGEYFTKQHNNGSSDEDLLETVFENGKLLIDQKFETIRNRVLQNFNNISHLLKSSDSMVNNGSLC